MSSYVMRKLDVVSPVPADIDIANSVQPVHINDLAKNVVISNTETYDARPPKAPLIATTIILPSGSHFNYVGDKHNLISAENKNMETPIHEACRQENVNVLMLLLEVNPMAACKVNPSGKSAFFVACYHDHLDLGNLSETIGLEVIGSDQACLYIAASRGDSNVVRELLNKWPDLTQLIDENGNSALRHACNKGHRDIVWTILKNISNLALLNNYSGYTPLHLGVMNGKVSVLNDFVSGGYASFQCLTREEETVFRLAVRYKCYDA
ncbi:ankyrin repeat-containing protein At2g01680-like [Vicia villosa]|uniref:ankyrin repeat-containing protein At2g01680-like n=1 Tax=Vicia villosa TaxID=3911 RepID=UPI00273AF7FA|nr:ankyrin repeat-containing protein At2g01680-like [Vicia villosa]